MRAANEVLKRMKRLLHSRILSRHAGALPRNGAGRRHQQRFHRRLLRRNGGNRSSDRATWCARRGFKNSFIFKYSPRPGTKGDELYADDVAEEVKKRRNNDLLAFQTPSAWPTTAAASAKR